jgi:hypothetical protein
MKRKLLSLMLVLAISLSCSLVAFAQGDNSKSRDGISRNTVITEKNIEKVLKHVGLDPSAAVKKQDSANSNTITTVGELEDALAAINSKQYY